MFGVEVLTISDMVQGFGVEREDEDQVQVSHGFIFMRRDALEM